MKVPLLDLKAQYATIRHEIEPVVREVFESQYFILGPQVKTFEESVAAYCGTRHAIGCASGTDAILLALMALDLQPGDEVITTPYTFFATGGCVARLGAKQVYCDIDPVTYNIDPSKIERLITKKTKAIMPVHLYGLVADMDRITGIAADHGLPVIEDAAQAIGASSPQGKAGALGTMGCFSFFPSKNLGGAGDGGMIVTNDADLAEKLRILRMHGSKPKYYHSMVGVNSRLDTLQAAVLQVKLKYLDGWSAKRRENAQTYTRLLAERGLADITAPVTPAGYGHIFNQYILRVPERDRLREHMAKHDIGTEIYYPVPLHLQVCFKDLGYKKGSMPESELAADTTIALPIYPELTPEMLVYVADTIASFYR